MRQPGEWMANRAYVPASASGFGFWSGVRVGGQNLFVFFRVKSHEEARLPVGGKNFKKCVVARPCGWYQYPSKKRAILNKTKK